MHDHLDALLTYLWQWPSARCYHRLWCNHLTLNIYITVTNTAGSVHTLRLCSQLYVDQRFDEHVCTAPLAPLACGHSFSSSLLTKMPSLSAYTQSPGFTVTPAIVTGTSANPGSLLLDFRGYVPSAFTPNGIFAMSSESLMQP